MHKRIAVDVDLVLCDPDRVWWEWLQDCGEQIFFPEEGDPLHYNLSKYFDIDPELAFEFWLQEDLYDELEVFPDAVDTLKGLYYEGWEIIFVSACQPEHQRSKEAMLKRDLDFLKPEDYNFISTSDKGFIKCDVIVDDRNKFLNQFSNDVFKIRMHTGYTQDATPSFDREAVNWYDVYNFITKEFKDRSDD